MNRIARWLILGGLIGTAVLATWTGMSLTPPQAIAQDDPEESDRPVIKKKTDESDKDAKDAKKSAPVKNPFPNRIPAPELDGGVEWLNTEGEISLKDLRGKVVLLDFWTFCCINCIHVLPDLAYLEKKFDKELVVIGVHSAKFDNERESGNIRNAIVRYEIAHPVINDAKMTVWRKFQVNSWPSFALIDPEGFYCGGDSGEGKRELLETVIGKVIAYHKSKGTLDETPVQFALERHKLPPGPLKFPGKILADPAGKRLFISDSNHNRIVISSLDGKLIDVIGSGLIGREDGTYDKARFDHPQGMCLVDNTLYVADTENHMLRAVDLDAKIVSTLAGNGKQGRYGQEGGKLRATSLNSPWDLYALDGVLYIAMAGPHQMWSHALKSDVIQPYAGSGREDIKNGSLQQSALAQPSGIASDGKFLFVVDSEGSSVRRIVTKKHAKDDDNDAVTTIAGSSDLPGGRCLFEFGDVDGVGDQARLQHPLGIVFHDGKLFVADTYNHKVKLLDPASKECETWLGTGKPGTELNPVQLAEPAGLTVAGETLFIADTNNHRILAVNLQSKSTTEFTIEGLEPPTIPDDAESETEEDSAPTTEVAAAKVKPGSTVRVDVGFDLPDEYKLSDQIPVTYTVKAEADQTVVDAAILAKRRRAEVADGRATIEVPVTANPGRAELTVSLSYGYCREATGGLCKIATTTWKIPVESADDAKSDALKLTASPKP